MPSDVIRIDGAPPRGWEFVRFEVRNNTREEEEIYVGVTARYAGERALSWAGDTCIVEQRETGEWLKVMDARGFLDRAQHELGEAMAAS